MKITQVKLALLSLVLMQMLGCSKFERNDAADTTAKQEELIEFTNSEEFSQAEKRSMVEELIESARKAEAQALIDMKAGGCENPVAEAEKVDCSVEKLNSDSGIIYRLESSANLWSSLLKVKDLKNYVSKATLEEIKENIENSEARLSKLVIQPRAALIADLNKNLGLKLKKTEAQLKRDFGLEYWFSATSYSQSELKNKSLSILSQASVQPAGNLADSQGRVIPSYNALLISSSVWQTIDNLAAYEGVEGSKDLLNLPLGDPRTIEFYAKHRSSNLIVTQKVKAALREYHTILSAYSGQLEKVSALSVAGETDLGLSGLDTKARIKLLLLEAGLKDQNLFY